MSSGSRTKQSSGAGSGVRWPGLRGRGEGAGTRGSMESGVALQREEYEFKSGGDRGV